MPTRRRPNRVTTLQRALTILWPSFLAAILAEGSFFSLFDPHELFRFGDRFALSPIAGYTIGFFFFWADCALASLLTYSLIVTPKDRNGRL
jgi:hypothetical protein